LIIKTLENKPDFKVIGYKKDNNWKWTKRKELYNLIHNCINSLKDNNVNVGDRVAYKGNNSIEWIAWNIATNSQGAIWVPMYANQNLDYCKHIVNDCEPKLLISDDNININNVKIIDNKIDNFGYKNNIDFKDNDISTLIYTSGTTGKPKGVMLSNNNIISNIETIRSQFSYIGPTTSLNILPWAHIYSQTCELYYNLLYDNKTAIASSRENFIKECRQIKPSSLYLVPKVLELIKSKLIMFDKPVVRIILPKLLKILFGGNLINIFTGGAKLDEITKKFFLDNKIIICEGYGCTETSPMVSVNNLIMDRDINSVGRILDDVIINIIDNEICVSGPNVMMGYWNDENATNKVLIKKDDKLWYKTGDKGRIENNFLYYEGRLNDNYKLSNGKFVNVAEVENNIKKHINGNFIVFGENMDSNSIISENSIDANKLKIINNDLDSYLRIKNIYKIDSKEMMQFLTPKMTIKRKLLINHILKK
jgi:long-chain acyl-CoA synthetase